MERKLTGRERMWKVMRYMRRFTVGDIIQMAEVSKRTAFRFISVLEAVGYIREEAKVKIGEGRGRRTRVFRLVKDTGPKALKMSKKDGKAILKDLNTGEEFVTEVKY